MSGPIVFISRNRIAKGRGSDFAAAIAGAVELIRATKPQTTLFAAYLDEAGTTATVVHAFPDAASLTRHFVGSDERTSAAAELIAPAGFEIYGRAPDAAVERLRREADASGARLDVHARPIGGFLRSPGATARHS